MVDRLLMSARIAAIRDAIDRIRAVLPSQKEDFLNDRTLREVVVLNLFVAIQESIDLATHYVADEGWAVPDSYRGVFAVLAERGILEQAMADELAAASGLRNLIAHRYGVLDFRLVYDVATTRLQVLEAFCARLAARG